MHAKPDPTASFLSWYRELKRDKQGFPPKGTVAGALVVLERLKTTCDLEIESHTAPGGSQIGKVSGAAARRILKQFGENRPLLSEGGRTNRGLRGAIAKMLTALKDSGLQTVPKSERTKLIESMQAHLVREVQAIHSLERLKVEFDPGKNTYEYVTSLLAAAQGKNQHGAVAEYLVGAKLQLRFPSEHIDNKRSSTADAPRRQLGDFQVKDTVFHVTNAPNEQLLRKCREATEQGYRCYLLVPRSAISGDASLLKNLTGEGTVVRGIEDFVAQNIDELGVFSIAGERQQLRQLLELYNKRVDVVEMDKSILIEIPQNL